MAETAITSNKTEHAQLTRFLTQQYLCESLTVAEVNILLNYLTVLHFNNDAVISDVGDVGDELYFVVQGEVALVVSEGSNEHEVVRSGAGEMLGMMSFFDKRALGTAGRQGRGHASAETAARHVQTHESRTSVYRHQHRRAGRAEHGSPVPRGEQRPRAVLALSLWRRGQNLIGLRCRQR